MGHLEENRVWSGEGALDREPIAGAVPAARSSRAEASPRVLARIPDVDQLETPYGLQRGTPPRGDGRIISKPLATKLLIGSGVLLVLVAVVSFLLRKPEIEGEKVLAPNAEVAPEYDPSAKTHVLAPMATPPAAELDLSFEIPDGPEFTVPMGPEITTTEPQHEVGRPSPGWAPSQSVPVTEIPGETPAYGGPYEVQPPTPPYGQQYQGPESGMPVAPRKGMTREPVEPPPASSETTSPQATYHYPARQPHYRADSRSDYRRDVRPGYSGRTYPPDPQHGRPGPVVPEGRYQPSSPSYPAYPAPPATQYPAPAPQHPAAAPGASYPSNISYPAKSYPATQPGAARLQGIITSPSARTTYDPARSTIR